MSSRPERIETFAVLDGHLVRKVVPARGRSYEHRCPREAFECIAHAGDGLGDAGFTLDDLAEQAGTPNTQSAVALAFLKERGIIDTRYRRNYAASDIMFEDAMVEYHALAENA